MSKTFETIWIDNGWSALEIIEGATETLETDEQIIYDFATDENAVVSFGMRLKRYLCQRWQPSGETDPANVSEETLKKLIIEQFHRTHTPFSFRETKCKVNCIVKNWLNAKTVRRETVFLLGFGLDMDVKDVSMFLTEGIGDHDYDMSNAMEAAYRHCHEKHLPLSAAQELTKTLSSKTGLTIESITSGCYLDLLDRARTTASGIFSDDFVFPEMDAKEEKDITAADLEKILSSGTPLTNTGNLVSADQSKLAGEIAGKRITRQRLGRLESGKARVERDDLLMMLFFVYSQRLDMTSEARCGAFAEETNSILRKCAFAELQKSEMFDTFLMMCLKTACPLPVYGDIFERSYL